MVGESRTHPVLARRDVKTAEARYPAAREATHDQRRVLHAEAAPLPVETIAVARGVADHDFGPVVGDGPWHQALAVVAGPLALLYGHAVADLTLDLEDRHQTLDPVHQLVEQVALLQHGAGRRGLTVELGEGFLGRCDLVELWMVVRGKVNLDGLYRAGKGGRQREFTAAVYFLIFN